MGILVICCSGWTSQSQIWDQYATISQENLYHRSGLRMTHRMDSIKRDLVYHNSSISWQQQLKSFHRNALHSYFKTYKFTHNLIKFSSFTSYAARSPMSFNQLFPNNFTFNEKWISLRRSMSHSYLMNLKSMMLFTHDRRYSVITTRDV